MSEALAGDAREDTPADRPRIPSYLLTSLGVAVPLTALFYVILHLASQGSYVEMIFANRGSIPYMTTYLTFVAIVQLTGLFLNLRRESHNLRTAAGILSAAPSLTPKGAAAAGTDLGTKVGSADRAGIIVGRVLRALRRVEKDGSREDLGTLLSEQAEIDRAVLSNSYALIRFVAWLIPVLGFIGTVSGISLAIAEFPALFASGSQNKEHLLDPITYNLGVAFDTTLIALIQIAVVMFLLYEVQKRGTNLLNGFDELCLVDLLGKVRPGEAPPAEGPASLEPLFASLRQHLTSLEGQFEVAVVGVVDRVAQGEKARWAALEGKFEAVVRGVVDRVAQGEQARWSALTEAFRSVARDHEVAIRTSCDAATAEARRVAEEIRDCAPQLRKCLQEQLEEGRRVDTERVRDLSQRLDAAGRRFEEALSARASQWVTACDQAAQSQERGAEEIRSAMGRLGELLRMGQELQALQVTLQANLAALSQTGDVRRALDSLAATMERLQPVLAELQKRRQMRVQILDVPDEQGDGREGAAR